MLLQALFYCRRAGCCRRSWGRNITDTSGRQWGQSHQTTACTTLSRVRRWHGVCSPASGASARRQAVLGICLGMQTLFDYSEEGVGRTGIGIDDDDDAGRRSFAGIGNNSGVAIGPHIGWNGIMPRMESPVMRHASLSAPPPADGSTLASVQRGTRRNAPIRRRRPGGDQGGLCTACARGRSTDTPAAAAAATATPRRQHQRRRRGGRRGGAQPKPVRLASRYYDEGANEVAFLNMITSHSSQKSHFYHSYALLSIYACIHRDGTSVSQMFQFRLNQKWYQCSPHRANRAKPRRAARCRQCVEAYGAGAGALLTGSGRTMVHFTFQNKVAGMT
ncbi:hypothetical protein ACHAW5_009766 [Stephanodiscus triporus]|uniref:Uncharacterized protein n=1 Tax=Stephanodiscus triporus TaxID=2934178 RepID=A0ABD3QW70_9STRA